SDGQVVAGQSHDIAALTAVDVDDTPAGDGKTGHSEPPRSSMRRIAVETSAAANAAVMASTMPAMIPGMTNDGHGGIKGSRTSAEPVVNSGSLVATRNHET